MIIQWLLNEDLGVRALSMKKQLYYWVFSKAPEAREFQESLSRYVKLLLRGTLESEAEDVLQTVKLKVQKLQPDAPIEQPKAYIRTIVSNCVRDRYRLLLKHRKCLDEQNLSPWVPLLSQAHSMEHDESTETNMIMAIDMDKMISQLSELEERVLNEHIVKGHTVAEVAKTLDISYGRASRAKQSLLARARKLLNDYRNEK